MEKIDIKSYQLFLEKYKNTTNSKLLEFNDFFRSSLFSIQQVFIDNFSLYETRFGNLSKNYLKLLAEKEDENMRESFEFSIFDIVKFKRKEEYLHSPILYKLLDVNGSHGQKDLFYRLFLKEILSDESLVERFTNSDCRDYSFKEEEYIKNKYDNKNIEQGEIDITIKSLNPNKKFAIIIECKWNSDDSCDNQIFKYYRNFIEVQGYNDENLLVLYLTKKGKDPNPKKVTNKDYENFLVDNKNINFFTISYKDHIQNWLIECINQCQSLRVKFLIEQYLKHIKDDLNNRR